MAHPKGVLIERLQKEGRQPRFDTRGSGPDHEPMFDSDVVLDGEVIGSGSGSNKRTAERRAAEEALAALDAEENAAPTTEATEPAGATTAGAARAEPEEMGEEFEGPWPIFDDVLAATLTIAHERVDTALRDDDARDAITVFALSLYKDVLQDLGDVVEVDD